MKKKTKLQELLKTAREIAATAENEERDFTSEERATITDVLEKAAEVKKALAKAEADAGMKDEILALNAEFAKDEVGPATEKGSLGKRFVDSPTYKEWLALVAPSGRVPERARGLTSPAVGFKSLLQKDLIRGGSETSAGAFITPEITGIYEPLGRYALNVFNLINRRETASDMVQFVRQTTQIQEAAPVKEAVDVNTGTKPEGKMEFEEVTAPVKNIAVWIPATKQALSDASQLRGLIDQELRDDLAEELEDQIVNGDGVGANFTGILNTSGILAQAWDTDLFTTTRRAITYLQTGGRSAPTAWVLHPSDWERIELTQDSTGRYYFAGPQARGPQTLWGVPVVTSQSLPSGIGLLADWRKAILWDREAASIQVSDSHADFFVKNLIAILAEMRAAFGLIRPSAFVEVDLLAAT